VLLGTDVLFELTLTAIAGNYLAEAKKGYSLQEGVLWHFSLACAIASNLLAEELGFKDTQCLYTAALLQEIGKLILDPYLEPDAEKFRALKEEAELNCCEMEEKLLGLNHAQTGGAVLSHWKLPEKISEAVAWHHDPSQNQISQDLSDLIQLSDMLVVSLDLEKLNVNACYPLDELKFLDAGIPVERIPELTATLRERLAAAESFLDGTG
ncbi:MAG: HDOD domain-containing protein, partial [Candidatus Delongbacteria bacterium]|nr:HDOD domain-containing protein [Candidatus Delongbacteria bacterium]